MKTVNNIILALSVILFFSTTANALTIEQKKMLEHRITEKVAQMNDYISFMASKKKTLERRQYYRTKALNLHIGKGNQYEENGVSKKGVMMEVTSVNRKSVSHPLIRDYFTNLINLKYTDVQITSTEIADIKVSNLQQIDTNLYVCTCQYDQAFVGYRDGRAVYKDVTTKRIKCYVYAEDTEDGTEFIILLGDVTALHTEKG